MASPADDPKEVVEVMFDGGFDDEEGIVEATLQPASPPNVEEVEFVCYRRDQAFSDRPERIICQFSNSNTITQKVCAKLDATPSPNLATNDAIRPADPTLEFMQELFPLLGETLLDASNTSFSTISTEVSLFLEPEDIASDNAISDDEKRERITAIFIRACSNGDIGKVGMMLGKIKETSTMKTNVKDWIDLNGKDEDGTPAIVYAACWGYADIIRILIEEGANVDDRDKNGWTPLLWACSNGHEDSAKTLIECGASKDLKSNRGRSLQDIVKRDASQEMRKILDMEQSKPESSFIDGSLFFAKDEDSGYGDDTKLKRDESQRISVAYPSAKSDLIPSTSSDSDSDKMDGILKVAIVNLQPSAQRRQRRKKLSKPIPANIMILCARYAHYWNTPEFLDTFFSKALAVIVGEIQKTPDDSHLLAHHIANTAQLIRYLRRDPGLRSSTTDHQATFTELLRELYVLFSHNLTRQLPPSFRRRPHRSRRKGSHRQHEIPKTLSRGSEDDVRFYSIRQPHQTNPKRDVNTVNISNHSTKQSRRFKFSHLPSCPPPYPPLQPPLARIVTPRTLLTILDSSKNALTSSGVHPSIIRQSIIQALHHINATLFNRVLTFPEMEDTPDVTDIPIPRGTILVNSLKPWRGLDAITIPQIGRTMVGYRYEIGEPSFPEEVEAYVMKVGEDIRRVEEDGDLEGLLDVVVPPFLLPAMSGTEADVGWAWARAVPFIPDGCMRMLDQESLEELGEGWDGGLS
ncbi:hypothetical protein BC829DRAFT_448315 [Chytridium lagenaria]|nr:hypothetical protein BC829DRAFT_448315 [Chytridium lagenaria]